MSITVKKAKLGRQDIMFDDAGNGASVSVERSDGNTRNVQKVNASHIPITSTCRAKKQASGAAVGTTDVDGTLVRLLADVEALAVPDGTTITTTGVAGAVKLGVKAGGIGATQLATDAVEEAKIKDGAVTATKLGASAVVEAKIDTGAVTETKIGAGAVVEAKIGAGAVVNSKLGARSVTNAKLSLNTAGTVGLALFPTGYVTGYTLDAGTDATTANIAVTGAEVGDIVMVSFHSNNTVPIAIAAASVTGAGLVSVTHDGNNSTTTKVNIITYRVPA